jgi:hypothetical protein
MMRPCTLLFEGANSRAAGRGDDRLPGVSNYFFGNDRSKWVSGAPHFQRVRYSGIYPGIDLEYHVSEGDPEFDLILAPGADPALVRMHFNAETLALDSQGDLVLNEKARSSWRIKAPTARQGNTWISVAYLVAGDGTVGLSLGPYDRSLPLRIDPVLRFSTYLGGSGQDDAQAGIVMDPTGNVYVAGKCIGCNFPTMNPFQASAPSSISTIIAELSSSGSTLLYATYLGGSSSGDVPKGISVDPLGRVTVIGDAISTDFPLMNPYQAASAGGNDAFITRLSAAGSSLDFSTYLGGSATETGDAVTQGPGGSLLVAGTTNSTNFPLMNPYLSSIGGTDAYVTMLDPVTATLLYSTRLGGSGAETVADVCLDPLGRMVVAGGTSSTDFPTQSPTQGANAGGTDAYLTVFAAGGASLAFSSYLGGSGSDYATGLAVSSAGDYFIAGYTGSSGFPLLNAYQTAAGAGFFAKIDPNTPAVLFSSFFGGPSAFLGRIATNALGYLFLAGRTGSGSFPVLNNFGPPPWSFAGFATVLSPTCNALVLSTIYGGTGFSFGNDIDADDLGNVATCGFANYDITPIVNAYQSIHGTGGGSAVDMYISKFSVVVQTPTDTPTPTATVTVPTTTTYTPTTTPTPAVPPVLSFTPTPTQSYQQGSFIQIRGLYPDPFRDKVHIFFTMLGPASVRVEVFNTAGELVKTLPLEGKLGANEIVWEGDNDSGQRCSSGIYVLHALANDAGGRKGEWWEFAGITR